MTGLKPMNFTHAVLVRKAALLACRTAPVTAVWELNWMLPWLALHWNNSIRQGNQQQSLQVRREMGEGIRTSCSGELCFARGLIESQLSWPGVVTRARRKRQRGARGWHQQQPAPQVVLQDHLCDHSYFICPRLQTSLLPFDKNYLLSQFLGFISEEN